MEISGKTAVITGGASGLGAATAKLLHSLGANVVIMDLNDEKGPAVCSELGSRAVFAKTNVTVTEEVQAAMKVALDEFGSISILVNCAGAGLPMKTVGREGPHDLNAFKTIVNINLIGTFDSIRWAAFYMQNNEPNEDGERGVIINTASVAAWDGQIGQAAYSASKAGIVGMTLTIARDMARSGIRCCTIAPGIFDTPMMALMPQKNRDSLAAQIPFPNRFGKDSEYAMMARQIIENPVLNGESIRLDGAIRMAPR
ncbi:MAG: 3-hydroxyacyl-CoA dehydrogenase [Deltaproteobacteria bacterium]|nr:3-hydroxyacyl-CoA dehydrogenase [Deltaproteobacteria bacterium]MBW2051583.1 3-hydroxyacyl-CoA dehydrogenase [Deltaproteobacteria bacterium]MBW2139872.1 3-hydroxyacyl-CoA dehydrogenase [Deltaproteobacteria bacterium]MBW2323810.1 3-hydroxyacyl-CoA dehydrogenase [Deltaproteobacteria bacterium]